MSQLYNILSWPAQVYLLATARPANYLPLIVCVGGVYMYTSYYTGTNNFLLATTAFAAGGAAYVVLAKSQGE